MLVETLWEVIGFGAKTGIVVAGIGAVMVLGAIMARARGRHGHSRVFGQLEVELVRTRISALRAPLHCATLPPKAVRSYAKAQRRQAKAHDHKRRTFLLSFDGDLSASAVDGLRAEVTAIVGEAQEGDRVLLKVKSPGGTVDGYGLAASQVARLRERGIPVTACVDNVAASGGYMLACVADEIVAAPFAIIGSIGVVVPLPNAHGLLKRLGIDYENATAGAHKRMVSVFAEPNPEGREKLQSKLDEAHALFKAWIHQHRPNLDIDTVATGEYWPAAKAQELGLVDRIATSDDVVAKALEDSEVLALTYKKPKPLREKLLSQVRALI